MPETNGKTELSQEIDDLLGNIEGVPPAEEETDLDIKSDEKVEEPEEKGGESVAEELEEDKEDEGAEEVEEEAGEEVKGKVEEEVEDVVEGEQETEEKSLSLEDQNKLLLDRVEELSKTVPAAKVEEVVEVIEETIASFIEEGEDIDDIVSDKGKLNALLVKVQQATEASTTKKILQSIPQMIVRQVQQHKVINDAVDEFYSENKDLKMVKGTVGRVANEVSAEFPDWTLDKVFKETGVRTRKLLGMKTDAVKKKVRKPALPKKPGSGGREKLSRADLSDLEKEVNELL